uniref:Translation initiation factor 3 N-terminal domain-containing protein n=1 Tax=Timema tahoe TaxID=61484 RepID=A0A7R9NUE0_9NEOP|nr:unnamed protein product [Timema tahoe]
MAFRSVCLRRGVHFLQTHFNREPRIGSLWVSNKSVVFSFEKSTLNRFYSAINTNSNATKSPDGVGAKKRKEIEQIITLLGTDGNIVSVISLLEAQKLSKRRNLKLLKIVEYDSKSGRPTYQLMSGAQYFEEEKKQRELNASKKVTGFKGEKLVALTSKISEHDLKSKLKNMSKWLEKNYEIRIVISGVPENMSQAEKIFDQISEAMKNEGRIVQKRQKGGDIRFQILPPKTVSKTSDDKNKDSEDDLIKDS